MKLNAIKLSLGTLFAGISAYFDKMLIPIAVLFAVMLLDYISGMISAYIKGEISSKKGMVGIIKKACYLMVVAAAIAFDYIIFYSCQSLGLGISYEPYFFCTLLCVWLIINELISILENLIKTGVPVPSFMKKAVSAALNKLEYALPESKNHKNEKGEENNE